MKQCRRCKFIRRFSDFGKQSKNRDRLNDYCRPCWAATMREWADRNRAHVRIRARKYWAANPEKRRAKTRKAIYGLLNDDYLAMLRAQSGVCAICDGTNTAAQRPALTVDHDHATGIVRGLLCDHCNTALGNFRDRADLLERALAYLKANAKPLLRVVGEMEP